VPDSLSLTTAWRGGLVLAEEMTVEF